MLVSQDFSCSGSDCCGNIVSGLTAAAMLAPVALLAVEAASAVCWWRKCLLQLRRWPWKGLQRSVGDGNGDAGGCGGVGGGSCVSGWSAMAMVSAAVALAEAFASVVEAVAVGTVAV
jgi:hypothetical protein